MTYHVENNILHTPKGVFKYSRNIKNTVEIGDTLVIRLEMMGTKDCINNLYAIRDGRQVWQVQDLAQYSGEPDSFHPGPYTTLGIYSKDNNLICANTSYGIPFLIDPFDGKIMGHLNWTK